MMGDPMFYCIASGLGGLAIGAAAGLSSVLMGDLCSTGAMHRRNRIDAARIGGGDLKPAGFCVSPSEILKLKGNFPQDDGRLS